jgi:hypothetical protein
MVSEICSPSPDSQGKIITRIGIVRNFPPDDPRNLHHPMQRLALIEFAKAIGRYVAEQEYKRLTNEEISIDEGWGECSDDANGGELRKVFNQASKRYIN